MTGSIVSRRRRRRRRRCRCRCRRPQCAVHDSSPLGRLRSLDYQATEGKEETLNWRPMSTFSSRDLDQEEAKQIPPPSSARTGTTRRQSREQTQANQRQDFLKSVRRISSVQLTVALAAVLLLLAFNLNFGQVVASTAHQTATDQQANEQASSKQQLEQLSAGGHVAVAPLQPHQHQQQLNDEEPAETRLSGDFRPTYTPNSGRLVDRIAEPLAGDQVQQQQQQQQPQPQQQQDKLNYIINFLRQNKLSKFCDLLTSPAGKVRELVQQLNGMRQFTLFVPTNEALMLMPGRLLESIEGSPSETRQFLMAHATSELVAPKLPDRAAGESLAQLTSKYTPSGALNRWSSGRPLERIAPPPTQQPEASNALIFSLTGSPLRIVTTPSSIASNSTKLELIVNGANVLSGHSHALQEPNNTSVTYAIVHLIDRPLYPVPKLTLLERLELVAPKFFRFLQASQDQWLLGQLNSLTLKQLTTAFVPNDDAFRQVPGKLLDQLETNRTFLQHFLRGHLVEGLYYSGQLAPPLVGHSIGSTSLTNSSGPQIPRLLISMAGLELEFESKVLQSRQLILVNSVPILEPDQGVLNGVIHLLVRPIFERHLMDVACNCESKSRLDNSTADWLSRQFSDPAAANANNNRLDDYALLEPQQPRTQRLSSTSLSSWFREANPRGDFKSRAAATTPPTNSNANSINELEREESQPLGSSQKIVRAQRSDGNLIARNNRDFYRPSLAPANLALDDQEQMKRRQEGPGHGLVLDPLQANATTSARLHQQEQQQKQPPPPQQQEAHQLKPAQWKQTISAPVAPQQQQQQEQPLHSQDWPPLSAAFEVERYKVVMNATMRQMLREQQLQQQLQAQQQPQQAGGLIMASSVSHQREALRSQKLQQAQPNQAQPSNLFAYDQPLATPPSPSSSASPLWTYSAPASAQTNQTSARLQLQDQVSSAASMQRHQRLLKFQAEDARDSLANGQSKQQVNSTSPSQKASSSPGGKTSVAPPNFAGCAFYDTECKRQQMGTKFVRLPARQASKAPQQNSTFQQQSLINGQQPALGNHQTPATSFGPVAAITPPSAFDSTFGETTESSLGLSQPGSSFSTPLSVTPQQQQPHLSIAKNYLNFSPPGGSVPRLSPLNQPLPPWSEDEHKLASVSNQQQQQQQMFTSSSSKHSSQGAVVQQGQNWRAQEVSDLSRIKLASGRLQQQQQQQQTSTSNLSSASVNSRLQQPILMSQQQQQVLLIPVKMLQDSNISMANSRLMRPNASSQAAVAKPIYFAPSQQQQQQQQQQAQQRPSGSATFNSNAQYFTPTLQPSSNVVVTGRPAASLGRLTNFTALESVPLDGFDAASSSAGGSKQPTRFTQAQNQQFFQQQQQQPAYVVQQQQDNQSAAFQSAIKQARKVVQRLQNTSPFQQHQLDDFNSNAVKGDISITSAKLTRPATSSSGGLAVQASNQLPFGASTAGLMSLPPSASSNDSSADFFQNRTIAEIMDDSGLRIDGQQVTFGRLRECLDRADLSNLIVQQGSELTIFMPTDLAFQRLVQQQALMQQRNPRGSSSSSSVILSARLTDPARRHLLPLIARAPNIHRPTDSSGELSRLQAVQEPPALTVGGDLSSAALAQRLTLDCSTQQVRQLLLDHLSTRLITPKQLQDDIVLDSLSGRRLLLSSVPSKKIVVVDGQPVIAATRAKNGMVYVVNKFLNISQQVPNMIDLLESQPNLKTFHSYLAFASLTDRLKSESGPLTILAPTNEAFEQLSTSARQLLNSDPAAMLDILRGHIIEGAQFGKLISMRNRLKTMNSDHFIEAKVIKPNIYQLDNQMTSMRLVGTSGNGVVNSIDRLIMPPWLRVSTGQTPNGGASRLPTVDSPSSSNSNQPRSVLELDDSLTGANGESPSTATFNALRQSASLNLPSLNNRPLRFEQPTIGRLAPTNSFSLAGTSTSSNPRPGSGSPNPGGLLDTFDVPPPPPPPPQPQPQPQSNSLNESPFLRIANMLTGSPSSTSAAGARLSTLQGGNSNSLGGPASRLAPSLNSTSTTTTTTTSSKNMLLIEKLAGLMKSRKFLKYLVKSRLSEQLKPDMNYVILVPTDQAIERLPKQIIDMLERDPERLGDLVNFHVLDTTFEYINTIPDGQTLNTLNEKDILFNWHRNNTILTASGAVVLGGIQEENIALLIVDRVLYPTPGDLLSIVTKSPILSNFTSLIKNAGLERQLAYTGPFTLFAPSDIAFNQLDKRDLEFLQSNHESARRFLLRHLSQPAVFTSSIALSNSTTNPMPQMIVTNSLGEDLTLRQKNDYFSVNDVNFSYADVAATNGVVHVIDGLL